MPYLITDSIFNNITATVKTPLIYASGLNDECRYIMKNCRLSDIYFVGQT